MLRDSSFSWNPCSRLESMKPTELVMRIMELEGNWGYLEPIIYSALQYMLFRMIHSRRVNPDAISIDSARGSRSPAHGP